MANSISIVAKTFQLLPSMYTSTITLHVPAGQASATIKSSPGTTFIDGSTSKLITGYITVTSNPLNSSVWNIQDIFPYSNEYATVLSLEASTLGIRSTLFVQGHTDSSGSISTLGPFVVSSLTHQGNPILTTSNLRSTINNLGNTYVSTLFYMSTMAGLGPIYISSTTLGSTVEGLGRLGYISTASLTSTLQGQSNYFTQSNVISTITGVGSNYISTSRLIYTLENDSTYTRKDSTISSVTSLSLLEQTSLASTVKGLGSYYISSSALQSTVDNLGSLYVSSAELKSFVAGFTEGALRNLLTNIVTNLGSNSYISTPQLTSTVAGVTLNLSSNVRTLGYISGPDLSSTVSGLGGIYVPHTSLQSTVESLGGSNTSNLVSTVVGLGRSGYISSGGVISTVVGVSNAYSSSLIGIYSLATPYISSAHLVSTVNGLGSFYISTASLVSTVNGINNMEAIPATAGQIYISSSGTVSTTLGLLSTSNLVSTATGLGNYYISSAHLVSTVNGLGSFYLSTGSLVSTTTGYFNTSIQGIVNTAGQTYISSSGTVSTTTGLLSTSNLVSTATGLGTYYISTAHLISTVNGLGPLYISTGSLVSTFSGFKRVEETSLVNMVINLGGTYVSKSGLTSTTSNLGTIFSNALISTVNGLGKFYISLPQLVAEVTPFLTYANAEYMTQNLTIPESNLNANKVSNIVSGTNYLVSQNFTTTSSNLRTTFSNTFTSTLDGLGTAKYISLTQLTSTVDGILSYTITSVEYSSTVTGYSNAQRPNLVNLVNATGEQFIRRSELVSTTTGIFISSNLTSTATGLGTYYISSPQLVSTVNGLGSLTSMFRYISSSSLTSTFISLSGSSSASLRPNFENGLIGIYITSPIVVSTVIGLSNIYVRSLNLISTVNNLGQYYISTPSITSTVTGLDLQRSNIILLTSTVRGLGQTYVSTLRLENTITMSNSSNLISTVTATVAYIPTLNMYPDGYIFYSGSSNLGSSSNFYEASNLTMVGMPVNVALSTIASGTVRTIGYGSNYIYGDGSYLTITSDRSLKEDIHPLDQARALDQVLSLRGVHYKKKGDTQPYIGCIAQEVEAVFPEVITVHPSIEPKDLRSMKYEFLLAPLVQSVKELLHTHSTLKYLVQKKYGNIQ